ncbi:hypothetical protein F2Q68_00007223 [Brassica cretica]|uniref:Uncharacterized protein n=1 Tax=Brassica cretica TaxID=69181 RepID=A0A8S9KWU3_BRACR|nr:hypothetical protein F2Q68_00007223 [Brassica cretica]
MYTSNKVCGVYKGVNEARRSGVASVEKWLREIWTVDFGFGSTEAKDGRMRCLLTSLLVSGREKTTPLSVSGVT